MKRFYDRSVRHRTVQAGDLVLCRADVNLRDKFAPALQSYSNLEARKRLSVKARRDTTPPGT